MVPIGIDFKPTLVYGVYISQLIPFARASSHVNDFNINYHNLHNKVSVQDSY